MTCPKVVVDSLTVCMDARPQIVGCIKATLIMSALFSQACEEERRQVTYDNEGVACLVADRVGRQEVPANIEPFVRVLVRNCGSSCEEIDSVQCDVSLTGNTVTVEAAVETSQPMSSPCSGVCQAIDVFCPIGEPLSAGDYVLEYAEQRHNFSVPGRDPSCEVN